MQRGDQSCLRAADPAIVIKWGSALTAGAGTHLPESPGNQNLGNTLNWLSSQAALGLQTDAAVTLYRLCRACNPYSARPSPRARASIFPPSPIQPLLPEVNRGPGTA